MASVAANEKYGATTSGVDVRVVGDAKVPRSVTEAVRDAAITVRSLGMENEAPVHMVVTSSPLVAGTLRECGPPIRLLELPSLSPGVPIRTRSTLRLMRFLRTPVRKNRYCNWSKEQPTVFQTRVARVIPLGLEEAHRDLRISPEEFDEVAAELGRTLDFFKVPDREKAEVLAAFAAH